MTCAHEDFEAIVYVDRLTASDDDPTVVGFSADIRIRCLHCGDTMVFFGAGLPVGMVWDRPAISVDGTELRCPIRPQSADPSFGLGLAGFQARLVEGMGSSDN